VTHMRTGEPFHAQHALVSLFRHEQIVNLGRHGMLKIGGGQLGIWKRQACLLLCPEIGGQGGKKAGSAR